MEGPFNDWKKILCIYITGFLYAVCSNGLGW